jgi:hypothetical protein
LLAVPGPGFLVGRYEHGMAGAQQWPLTALCKIVGGRAAPGYRVVGELACVVALDRDRHLGLGWEPALAGFRRVGRGDGEAASAGVTG